MKEYLTESKLEHLLEEIFPESTITPQFSIKIPGELGRKRVDYMVVFQDKRILVEYDGHLHYSSSKTQMRDELVSIWSRENGYIFVQIPYFIQPDVDVLRFLFGDLLPENLTIPEVVYPHGFVSETCVLPSDFNVAGVDRFYKELTVLPEHITDAVLQSLQVKTDNIFQRLYTHPMYAHFSECELKGMARDFVFPKNFPLLPNKPEV